VAASEQQNVEKVQYRKGPGTLALECCCRIWLMLADLVLFSNA